MNFSDIFKQTNQLCVFSPDSRYLANAVHHRVVIRDVKTLQVTQVHSCLDAIQYIEWSPDSQFILCGMYKRSLVQVWSLEQPEWTCKIDEGSAGLIDVRWSPDSRHILTTADFHLRITIWSLINKSVSYIKHPKPCSRGLDFTTNGKYLAVAERRECKDYVSIFDCSSWQLVKHFCTETEDLEGIRWSPDGYVLCIWESCLQYKLSLFSLDGRCLSSYSAYDMALGIKSVTWSPTSQFIAVGSYDEKLRLLNHITWKLITEFPHSSSPAAETRTVYYREAVKNQPLLNGETSAPSNLSGNGASHYEIVSGNIQIPVTKPDPSKANPRIGIGTVAFSSDSRYVVTKNDSMPSTVWIWDIQKLKCAAVLMQESSIRCIAWDPVQPRLALSTGNNNIYMWSPEGTLSVQVPCESGFTVQEIKWLPSGGCLALIGREQMCLCFITTEDE